MEWGVSFDEKSCFQCFQWVAAMRLTRMLASMSVHQEAIAGCRQTSEHDGRDQMTSNNRHVQNVNKQTPLTSYVPPSHQSARHHTNQNKQK